MNEYIIVGTDRSTWDIATSAATLDEVLAIASEWALDGITQIEIARIIPTRVVVQVMPAGQ